MPSEPLIYNSRETSYPYTTPREQLQRRYQVDDDLGGTWYLMMDEELRKRGILTDGIR